MSTKKAIWTFAFPNQVQQKKTPPVTKWRARKPIRSRSKQMSKRMVEYGKVRRLYLADNPWCEVCFTTQATEIHHMKKRGRYLLAVDTFLAVCRTCHNMIESSPSWAFGNGYSIRIAGEKIK